MEAPARRGNTLEAVLKFARPTWSAQTTRSVLEKLGAIGIATGPALAQALRNDRVGDLNNRLRAAGLRSFTADTLQALGRQAALLEAPAEEPGPKALVERRGGGRAPQPETRALPVFFRQGLQERPASEPQQHEPPSEPARLSAQREPCPAEGTSGTGAAAGTVADAVASGEVGREVVAPMQAELGFYLVDNSRLQSPAEGLGPRLSKRLSDKDERSCIPWGTRVCACDEGDGWLRVDNWYLPMSVNGVLVIVEDSTVVRLRISSLAGELCEVDADRSWPVRDLKREIEGQTQIPWREQQLFAASAQLHDADELDAALPAGKAVEVTLVRVYRSPEQIDWLVRVESDGLELRHAPQNIKHDHAVVCAAVRQDGRALEFAAQELQADRPLVQAALRIDGAALAFAAGPLRADPELRQLARKTREGWLQRVQANGMQLSAAPASCRADKEIVVAAVRQNGWALQHAAYRLQADRETVIAAVQGCGRALRHAAVELRADREVVLAAVQASGHALELAADELKADRELVLAAARRDGSALAYADAGLRSDREVVMAAISQDGAAVTLAGALWHDDEIRRIVARQHGGSVSLQTRMGAIPMPAS